MKKVENMPVMRRPRMAAVPVKVRSFRIRSGMIGLARRDSSTTKNTSRASAMPSTPNVWAETQPYVVAVTTP